MSRVEHPPGLAALPFSQGYVVLLTPRQLTTRTPPGKWWKRDQAMLQREQAAAPAESAAASAGLVPSRR